MEHETDANVELPLEISIDEWRKQFTEYSDTYLMGYSKVNPKPVKLTE